MSYVSSLYHIVFSTKGRQRSLNLDGSAQLYAVICGIIAGRGSKALIVNGVKDHIHILLALSPSVSLSDMVRDIKSQSSVWIKNSGLFPYFTSWEKEYGAFTLSNTHKKAVYDYIRDQRTHHAGVDFAAELDRLLAKANLEYYRKPDTESD